MHRQHVMAIVNTENQALNVINDLRAAGFMSQDVSVLLSDQTTSTKNVVYEKHTKAPEGAVQGASTGGILGGAVGWLAGIGSLAIPGLGPFIAAGPIMAALSGVAIGATVGGFAGALVGMGTPEYEAKQYEAKLKEGKVLISVHVEEDREIKIVKDIFHKVKAQDVIVANEVSSAKF